MSHGADYCQSCGRDLFLSVEASGCDCESRIHCKRCGREWQYCNKLPCDSPEPNKPNQTGTKPKFIIFDDSIGGNMSQSKATPRPFHVRLNNKHRKTAIYNDDMTFVADCADENDAELIVRAVNCHDSAIKLLSKVIADYEGETDIGFDQTIIDIKDFLEKVRG